MTEEKSLGRIKELFDELSQETDRLQKELLEKESRIAEQDREIEILKEKAQNLEAAGREIVEGVRKLEMAFLQPEKFLESKETLGKEQLDDLDEVDIDFEEMTRGAKATVEAEKEAIEMLGSAKDAETSSGSQEEIIDLGKPLEQSLETSKGKGKRGLYEKLFGESLKDGE